MSKVNEVSWYLVLAIFQNAQVTGVSLTITSNIINRTFNSWYTAVYLITFSPLTLFYPYPIPMCLQPKRNVRDKFPPAICSRQVISNLQCVHHITHVLCRGHQVSGLISEPSLGHNLVPQNHFINLKKKYKTYFFAISSCVARVTLQVESNIISYHWSRSVFQ